MLIPSAYTLPPDKLAKALALARAGNWAYFGNTTAGTIPLAMQTAREDGRLKKGELVLATSVGAGFTVGSVLLRWEI